MNIQMTFVPSTRSNKGNGSERFPMLYDFGGKILRSNGRMIDFDASGRIFNYAIRLKFDVERKLFMESRLSRDETLWARQVD